MRAFKLTKAETFLEKRMFLLFSAQLRARIKDFMEDDAMNDLGFLLNPKPLLVIAPKKNIHIPPVDGMYL